MLTTSSPSMSSELDRVSQNKVISINRENRFWDIVVGWVLFWVIRVDKHIHMQLLLPGSLLFAAIHPSVSLEQYSLDMAQVQYHLVTCKAEECCAAETKGASGESTFPLSFQNFNHRIIQVTIDILKLYPG